MTSTGLVLWSTLALVLALGSSLNTSNVSLGLWIVKDVGDSKWSYDFSEPLLSQLLLFVLYTHQCQNRLSLSTNTAQVLRIEVQNHIVAMVTWKIFWKDCQVGPWMCQSHSAFSCSVCNRSQVIQCTIEHYLYTDWTIWTGQEPPRYSEQQQKSSSQSWSLQHRSLYYSIPNIEYTSDLPLARKLSILVQ